MTNDLISISSRLLSDREKHRKIINSEVELFESENEDLCVLINYF
jgi:hypothetical protein